MMCFFVKFSSQAPECFIFHAAVQAPTKAERRCRLLPMPISIEGVIKKHDFGFDRTSFMSLCKFFVAKFSIVSRAVKFLQIPVPS